MQTTYFGVEERPSLVVITGLVCSKWRDESRCSDHRIGLVCCHTLKFFTPSVEKKQRFGLPSIHPKSSVHFTMFTPQKKNKLYTSRYIYTTIKHLQPPPPPKFPFVILLLNLRFHRCYFEKPPNLKQQRKPPVPFVTSTHRPIKVSMAHVFPVMSWMSWRPSPAARPPEIPGGEMSEMESLNEAGYVWWNLMMMTFPLFLLICFCCWFVFVIDDDREDDDFCADFCCCCGVWSQEMYTKETPETFEASKLCVYTCTCNICYACIIYRHYVCICIYIYIVGLLYTCVYIYTYLLCIQVHTYLKTYPSNVVCHQIGIIHDHEYV